MPGSLYKSLALAGGPAVVSGLFINKKATKDDPIGGPLWDVTRVGNSLEDVKAEYAATLASGELKADGYNPTGCFPDRNLKTRDLHDSEMSYEGPISVIKYENVVAKTELKPMTHEVCYEFCRRFDGIKFFAITNGNKCYCEPNYVLATAGNSGGCKVPCEGNSGQMCGGPDMSSVFAMHNCPPKEKFSTDKISLFNSAKDGIKTLGEATKTCVDNLVKAGSKLVETQKQKGNTVSMPHQKALTEGYQQLVADLNALPFVASDASASLETALGAYAGLGGGAKESDVEKAMQGVEMTFDAVDKAGPQLASVYEQCHPNVTITEGAASFYTTINEGTSAQSCSGKFIGTPKIVSGDNPEDSCASLCSETLAPEQCVGFQVYKGLLEAPYTGPKWVKQADHYASGKGEKFGSCQGMMRYTSPSVPGESAQIDFSALPYVVKRYYCWGYRAPYGSALRNSKDGICECSETTEQVGSAGEICMLFSEISGVTQYNKPECPTTAPMEGHCYVPKTDLKAHQLHTKSDTVSLPYCFNE